MGVCSRSEIFLVMDPMEGSQRTEVWDQRRKPQLIRQEAKFREFRLDMVPLRAATKSYPPLHVEDTSKESCSQ